MRLHVVITSVRETRVGPVVADWFMERAAEHGGFEVELIDLKAVALPVLSEPNHPRRREYTQETTRAWSRSVAAADAFVFVVPEYNYAMPPSLLNALDHVYWEWHYKPAGFVSYGGVSGGLRSVQSAKPVLTTLRMMPVPEGVSIPFVATHIQDGRLNANDKMALGAKAMLDELVRWAEALRPLRADQPEPSRAG